MDRLNGTRAGVGCLIAIWATINLLVSNFALSDALIGAEGCANVGKLEMDIDLTITYEKSDKMTTMTNHTHVHLPVAGQIGRTNCPLYKAQHRIVVANSTIDVVIAAQSNNGSQTRVLTDINMAPFVDDNNDDVNKRNGGAAAHKSVLLYEFPANQTYRCRAGHRLVLHSSQAHASLVFSQLRIQPLAKMAKSQRGKTFVCQQDRQPGDRSSARAEYFIPLILAVCLSVFAILLVLGYIVHRKIRGRGYTSVE